MKITERQLRSTIRKELRKTVINEAPTMVRSLNDVSSVGEKIAIINQYDDIRNDYLDNQGSRRGNVMAKWRSHKNNGEKLTLVARAYVERFEPRIHALKLDLDDAQRAGDSREVKRLADDLFNIIYYENANLPINTGRFGKGGIGAAIGMVTGNRKIIMGTDMPLRRELIQIKNWLDRLKSIAK